MKKVFLICIVVIFGLILVSCSEDKNENPTFERKIASGSDFSLVITEKGNLYGFGSSFGSMLGQSDLLEDIHSEPILLDSYFNLSEKETFISIHAGSNHAYAVTSSNRIFTWGWNLFGQTGVDDNNQVIASPIDITSNVGLEDNEKIKVWAQGDFHTILLTTKNRVLGWGNNTNSNLGTHTSDLPSSLGTYVLVALDMTPLFNLDENETIISVGENLALTSMNRIFGWGAEVPVINESSLITDLTHTITLNTDEVVLEIQNDSNIVKTNQDRFLAHVLYHTYPSDAYEHNWFDIKHDQKVDIETLVYGKNDNSIIIDKDHKVWLHGKNAFANLGTGHTDQVVSYDDDLLMFSSYFSFEWDIDWLENEYVIDMTMSLKNTILITNKNRIFIMGDNTKGQIGDGTTTIALTPKLLVIED